MEISSPSVNTWQLAEKKRSCAGLIIGGRKDGATTRFDMHTQSAHLVCDDGEKGIHV